MTLAFVTDLFSNVLHAFISLIFHGKIPGVLIFASIYLQQKIHCVFVDVSELVVLLPRHTIDVKEDITF